MPKVSIIIPVYNVSAYLRRCLDSAVKQTLRDIEIIIVNDESPDHEDSDIMQEYKAKYPELIRLIFHEKNLGLGGARNTGIKAAKGEYLMFIDSDDWVTLDAAEKFYSCALENNADLVICTCMYQNKNNYKKQPDNFYPYYFPPNIPINYFAPLYFMQKQLIIDNQAFFPEQCYFEDNATMPIWKIISKKTAYINDAFLYYYFTHDSSIMTASANSFRFFTDLFKAYDHTLATARRLSLLKNNRKFLLVFILKFLFGRFNGFLEKFPENFNYAVELMSDFIKRNRELTFTEKKLNKSIAKFFRYIISQERITQEQFDDIMKYYPFTEYFLEIQNIFKELNNKGFTRFAIWGAGKFGAKFAMLCRDLDIHVEITDKNPKLLGTVLPSGHIVKPFEELAAQTDAIIVTNSRFYDNIAEEAKQYGNFEIVNMQHILAL